MSDSAIAFTPEIYQYYLSHTVRPQQFLDDLRGETAKLSTAKMQICPEQGVFLQMLIKMMKAKKTLEIGTFTGYSALSVALALPEDGKIIACDINKEWTDIAKKYWRQAGVDHKIELRLGPGLITLESLIAEGAENSFDFIFIDADKLNYLNYYEAALPLVRPGGVIAIDNVLWYGEVANQEDQRPSTRALRQFNTYLYQDERIDLSMLPIGDGLTLAMKRNK